MPRLASKPTRFTWKRFRESLYHTCEFPIFPKAIDEKHRTKVAGGHAMSPEVEKQRIVLKNNWSCIRVIN